MTDTTRVAQIEKEISEIEERKLNAVKDQDYKTAYELAEKIIGRLQDLVSLKG
ncbi:MAG: hypothetical protein ACOH19_14985 [Rhodoglobus sp.]